MGLGREDLRVGTPPEAPLKRIRKRARFARFVVAILSGAAMLVLFLVAFLSKSLWLTAAAVGAQSLSIYMARPSSGGQLRNAGARRVAAAMLPIVLFAGSWVVCRAILRNPQLAAQFSLIFAAGISTLPLWISVADRRGRAEVIAAKWRLCLNCRYPLVEESASGLLRCPECGLAETAAVIEETWRRTYRGSAALISERFGDLDVMRGRVTRLEAAIAWGTLPAAFAGLIGGWILMGRWIDLLSPVSLIGGAALSALIGVSLHQAFKRGYRRIQRADHLMCLYCRQSLVLNRARPHWLCESCGVDWDTDVLRRSWRSTYRHRVEDLPAD